MNFEYPFSIEAQEPAGFLVQFDDIEEAFTEGETIEECCFNAAEVLTGILEYRIENKLEIPLPSKSKSKYKTAPSASVQAALLVRFNKKDRTLADLARTLGVSWPVVQRLENPKHSPTLKQLEKAAAALGKRLVISFE